MQKNLTVLFAVAVLAVGFATPAYAAPKESCLPWPACKDDAQGEGQSTCNNEYFEGTESPGDSEARGPCTDMNGGSCDLVRFTDTTPGWRFTEHCKTSETIVIKPDNKLLDGEAHMLELVVDATTGLWAGDRAAITNEGGQAVVRNLTIHVAKSTVANGSCNDSGFVEAAISFDPHLGIGGVPGTRAQEVKITRANGAQFCNAIELNGDTAPDQETFHSAGVRGSEIDRGSYSNFGIFVTNINNSDSSDTKFNDVSIVNNRVHYSANGCVAIQVGPWVERANIQDNDVEAPGGVGCASNGVGISILTTGVANVPDGNPDDPDDNPPTDDFRLPLPADIVGNIVNLEVDPLPNVGISIVDSAIDKNQKNAIIGDDGDIPYLCDNSVTVSFPTKGKKKNTFFNVTIESESVIKACSP